MVSAILLMVLGGALASLSPPQGELVGLVCDTLTVTVRVSRVSVIVSVRDSVE